MDTRDVKEIIFPNDGDYLREIFDLQKQLLNHYIKIESLPDYPIDLHTRDNQVLLKDFSARVIEELGEAMESYEKALGKGDLNIMVYEKTRINHIYNFNEELGDALHFMVELMIYSGIGYETLGNLETLLVSNYVTSIHNFINPEKTNTRELNLTYVEENDYHLVRGGRFLSIPIRDQMAKLLWDIVYDLQLARNSLKNKPWKQSEMLTDENLYQKHTIWAFRKLMGFFDFVGMEAKDIYVVYYKKNMINQFRIRSKY